MRPFRVRTFQGRIFFAVFLVMLLPAAVAVTAGVFVLQQTREGSGTLGAWGEVAESGRVLLESLDSADTQDPSLRTAAEEHRQALSESVRLSRLYSFVADRFIAVLPLVALAAGILVAGLAFLTARALSRSFGGPIQELVRWTERIGREEPLPPEGPGQGVEELEALRSALRLMADDLAAGRAKAIEAAQMRSWSELARRVAHEIKNPLTSMRMAAATLAREKTGAEADAATVLQEEIARLDHMARTFSQFGRLPEGPRSEVDVGELLESLAAQHSSEEVSVDVRVEGDVCVSAHFDALQRAVRNLLVNAMEAQPGGGGWVRLSAMGGDDDVCIVVEDGGPGIPDEMLQQMWRPDVTTKRHGTGLGLAIVRQTVLAHGGRVEAHNAAEGGAALTLHIPRAETPGRPDGADHDTR